MDLIFWIWKYESCEKWNDDESIRSRIIELNRASGSASPSASSSAPGSASDTKEVSAADVSIWQKKIIDVIPIQKLSQNFFLTKFENLQFNRQDWKNIISKFWRNIFLSTSDSSSTWSWSSSSWELPVPRKPDIQNFIKMTSKIKWIIDENVMKFSSSCIFYSTRIFFAVVGNFVVSKWIFLIIDAHRAAGKRFWKNKLILVRCTRLNEFKNYHKLR